MPASVANGEHSNAVEINDQHTPNATDARRSWAALIKQVWRVDPLVCTRCGATMKIIAFIQPAQRAVIERILRRCGLWEQRSRGPPTHQGAANPGELRYVSDLEFVDAPAPAEPVWTAH